MATTVIIMFQHKYLCSTLWLINKETGVLTKITSSASLHCFGDFNQKSIFLRRCEMLSLSGRVLI